MPGMQSGLSDTNPIIVAAFKAALLHQGLIIAAVLALLALAWLAAREFSPGGSARESRWSFRGEGPARRVLRGEEGNPARRCRPGRARGALWWSCRSR